MKKYGEESELYGIDEWDHWLEDEATWRFLNAVDSLAAFMNTI